MFVGIVDAQLLEAVVEAEVLEAEYVEDADRVALVFARRVLLGEERVVHLEHDPVEEGAVEALGHRVATGYRLRQSVVDDQRLAGRPRPFGRQRLHQRLLFDSEQFGDEGHHVRVLDADRLVVVVGGLARLELDVAEQQDGRQDREEASLFLRREPDHLHRLFQPRELVVLVDVLEGQTRLVQVVVLVGGLEVEDLAFLHAGAGKQVVEHVVVALVAALRADPRLLQQVLLHHGAVHHAILLVVHLDEFTEAAATELAR